jgi:hypothetical protein
VTVNSAVLWVVMSCNLEEFTYVSEECTESIFKVAFLPGLLFNREHGGHTFP